MSASLFVDFFINSLLTSSQFASANDADTFGALCVADQQEPRLGRGTDQGKAFFTNRVIRVGRGNSKMVAEDRRCLLEGNPVLAEVLGGFVRVPFKLHVFIVAIPSVLYEAKVEPNRVLSGER